MHFVQFDKFLLRCNQVLTEEEPWKIGFFRSGSAGYDYPSERQVDFLVVLKFKEESGACHHNVWNQRR